jgi:hypothetical protein
MVTSVRQPITHILSFLLIVMYGIVGSPILAMMTTTSTGWRDQRL